MKLRFRFLIAILLPALVSCNVFFPITGDLTPTRTFIPTQNPTEPAVATNTPTTAPSDTPTTLPETPTPTQASNTPTATPPEKSPDDQEDQIFFGLQPGSPTKIHAWSHGCNWLGVAGQIFDRYGKPLEGIIVEAGGVLAGLEIIGLSVTGVEEIYGPGGYEIQFQEQPTESSKTIWIQVKDSSGQLLSDRVFLDTVNDCNQNLIVLNFIEIVPGPEVIFYLPIVIK